MSQTLGIGTIYFGRTDLRERRGVCGFCNRSATLRSFETRRWFILLFIPIAPLGWKRVMDRCSSCGCHRVMDLQDWKAAKLRSMEEGVREAHDHPESLEALRDLQGSCLAFGEWDKADQLADRIEKEFGDSAEAHRYLASVHAYRNQEDRRRRSLDRAQALDPEFDGAMPTAGRDIGAKAGQGRRQRLVFSGVILAVLIALVWRDRVQLSHRTLHVVNGYQVAVDVDVPGAGRVLVGPWGRAQIELPEGSYSARVTGALSCEIPFEIRSFFVARAFDQRVFVLNPGGTGIVILEERVYTSRPLDSPDQKGGMRFIYGRPFMVLAQVDYPFVEFPESISTKASTEVRSGLALHSGPAFQVYLFLMSKVRKSEAAALAEWAIDAHPDRDQFLQAYSYGRVEPAYRSRGINFLRSRLSRRPVDGTLHMAYQDLRRGSGEPGLEEEYEAFLHAEPGNSLLLYFRGRVATGVASTLAYTERALAADAANLPAQRALVYLRCCQGRWREALEAYQLASIGLPGDDSLHYLGGLARVGLGQGAELSKELHEQLRRNGFRPGSSTGILIQLVARSEGLPAALAIVDEGYRAQASVDPNGAAEWKDVLRCQAFYAAGDFAGLEREAAPDKKHLRADRNHAMIELGRLDQLSPAEAGDLPEAFSLLAQSIVAKRNGDADLAAQLRENAAVELRKGPPDWSVAALLLSDRVPPTLEGAVNLKILPREKAVLLTALAQSLPKLPPEIPALAAALNALPEFPQQLISRALADLEKKR